VKVVLLNYGELSESLSRCGLDVEVMDEVSMHPAAVFWRLCQVVKSFDPDVLHTHRYKENLLGQVANACFGRAKVFRTNHGRKERPTTLLSPARWFMVKAEEISGKRAVDCNIAVSKELAEWLSERGWRNVRCIPNGIDVSEVQLSQEATSLLTSSGDRTRIGFVGRLEPVKRADLFIEIAWQAVCRAEWNADWHIFGDGSQRASLEARVKQLGIEGHVKFHGHQTDVVRWLRGLDVLVMTSDHEGLPMVLLEALAAGTPVVGHAVGGIKEVLSKLEVGALVYEQNPESYLQAIRTLTSGGKRFESIRAAQQLVQEQYSVDRMVEQTIAAYSSAVVL